MLRRPKPPRQIFSTEPVPQPRHHGVRYSSSGRYQPAPGGHDLSGIHEVIDDEEARRQRDLIMARNMRNAGLDKANLFGAPGIDRRLTADEVEELFAMGRAALDLGRRVLRGEVRPFSRGHGRHSRLGRRATRELGGSVQPDHQAPDRLEDSIRPNRRQS